MSKLSIAALACLVLGLLAASACGSTAAPAPSARATVDPFVGDWRQEAGSMSFQVTVPPAHDAYFVAWCNGDSDASPLHIEVHQLASGMYGTDDGAWSFEMLRPGVLTVLYPTSSGLAGQAAFRRQ